LDDNDRFIVALVAVQLGIAAGDSMPFVDFSESKNRCLDRRARNCLDRRTVLPPGSLSSRLLPALKADTILRICHEKKRKLNRPAETGFSAQAFVHGWASRIPATANPLASSIV
jgi:hypothetical protein